MSVALLCLFLLAALPAGAQSVPVRGVVTGGDGEALVGCMVIVKGNTSQYSVTDVNGAFELKGVSAGTVLNISYLGYQDKSVKAETGNVMKIVLEQDRNMIEETVVVGYGTQKKGLVTSSVSIIKNEDILTTASNDLNSRLQGKVSGLGIRQNSGQPGSDDFSINVRGFGEPIFIVDGSERISAAEFNRLNPEDIESVSVLKDGSAAVYGMNAGNGVILVTTKKGEAGNVRIDLNASASVAAPTEMPKMMNSVQYMTMRNEAAMNVGGAPVYSQSQIDKYLTGELADTDWYAATMKKAVVNQNYSVTAQGGTDKVHFYTSLGYVNQPGLLRSGAMGYQRFQFRSNLCANITKNLTLEAQAFGEYNETNNSAQSVFNIMRGTVSTLPMHTVYANGNESYYNYTYDGQAYNPVAMADADTYGYQKARGKAFSARTVITYKAPFLKGLSFKISGQFRSVTNKSTTLRKSFYWYTYDELTDEYTPIQQNSPTYMQTSFSDYNTLTMQTQALFDRSFGNHHVTSTLVYEQRNLWNSLSSARRDFSSYVLDQMNFGDTDGQQNSGADSREGYSSFVGKFSYDYKGRYMAEFDFREDGSYRYSPKHRWGFFPVFQLGWRMSQEPWFEPLKQYVSNFKIRASYGTVGEDAGTPYQYMAGFTLGQGGYKFSDSNWTSGAKISDIVNEDLTWYVSKMMDLGVELGFFNNALKFEGDIYRRNRSGLLTTRARSLPDTFGGTLPQENLNSDRTDGVEFSLSYSHRVNRDFSFNVGANFNYARTKNIYIEQSEYNTTYTKWRSDKSGRWSDIVWVYDVIGQFQSEEEILNSPIQDGTLGNSKTLPGDYKYRDVDGNGVINSSDVLPIALNGTPKMHYGLTIGAKFYGVDFSMLLQGSAKYTIYMSHNYAQMFWNDGNMPEYFYDRWHKADYNDPNSEWILGQFPAARTTADAPSLMYAQSSVWRRNASYLRLKSMELGYTIPAKVLKKTGIKNIRVYVSGYNIFTICDKFVKAFDPEKSEGTNNTGWVYPLNKSFNAGFNIRF